MTQPVPATLNLTNTRRAESLPDCLISDRSANSQVKGCFEADSAGIIENASSPIRAAP